VVGEGNSKSDALIQLSRVSKGYREGRREHQVLVDLDLQVAAGEAVALLGRSGSGKSTLLNLVSGIDRPDSGEITVAGHALHTLPERQRTLFRRRSIGFVFQFFNLLPTLTVLENLQLPLQLNALEDDGRARRLLASVGLAGREDDFPDVLSGGEQQRVAIARALVHAPALVLADEPTGNLDAETGDRILKLLLERTREQGNTLLMATHSLEMARRADRLLRVEAGQLVEVEL
jgi:putative ABC transport system ATP-binding protein